MKASFDANDFVKYQLTQSERIRFINKMKNLNVRNNVISELILS